MIVQNDDGSIANADCYVFPDQFVAYHGARGRDVEAIGMDQIGYALVQATDYIDSTYAANFVGAPLNQDQSTRWPRSQAYDSLGNNASDKIPEGIKRATMELAYIALTTGQPLEQARSAQTIKSKTTKVDVITTQVEYVSPFEENNSLFPAVEKLLSIYLRNNGTSVFVKRG